MNTFLQIAIGLAPIEVFLLMFAFLKKKPRIPQLVIGALWDAVSLHLWF